MVVDVVAILCRPVCIYLFLIFPLVFISGETYSSCGLVNSYLFVLAFLSYSVLTMSNIVILFQIKFIVNVQNPNSKPVIF